MLADLGSLRLGHDHAHEIVRLRVGRGDAHGVPRVMFGLRQRAPGEEHEGERLGHRQIVGIEPHDPLEQRLGRSRPALRDAKLVEQREGADVFRRTLEKFDDEPLGLGFGARREGGAGVADLRPRLRPRRSPVEPATARGAEPAAARARRGDINRIGKRHERQPYSAGRARQRASAASGGGGEKRPRALTPGWRPPDHGGAGWGMARCFEARSSHHKNHEGGSP